MQVSWLLDVLCMEECNVMVYTPRDGGGFTFGCGLRLPSRIGHMSVDEGWWPIISTAHRDHHANNHPSTPWSLKFAWSEGNDGWLKRVASCGCGESAKVEEMPFCLNEGPCACGKIHWRNNGESGEEHGSAA